MVNRSCGVYCGSVRAGSPKDDMALALIVEGLFRMDSGEVGGQSVATAT